MLSREMLQEELQKYDFDRLARREPNGRRRIRLLALAHLKEGRNHVETAQALRTTRHAVMRWMQWFAAGGMNRLAGVPHTWSTQRLPPAQEEAFRQAVERLQAERGGGRLRGEDIRQLLDEQFHVHYSRDSVYRLLKRLKIVWISVRSINPDTEPAAQAEFKKKLRPTGAGSSAARRHARTGRHLVSG
jgi:transposase